MKPMRDIFRSWAVFDDHGRHTNGTDKQSNHAYGNAYDSILNRESIKLMLEIGVADGSSLCAWQEALPNAKVVGMDIHSAAKWGGEFHLGDQRSREDCIRVAANRQFDLIVEDATHNLANTLLTLYWLWPFVAHNGLYIVEEWDGAAGDRARIQSLFGAVVVDTIGPSGGIEPLVVMRKQ